MSRLSSKQEAIMWEIANGLAPTRSDGKNRTLESLAARKLIEKQLGTYSGAPEEWGQIQVWKLTEKGLRLLEVAVSIKARSGHLKANREYEAATKIVDLEHEAAMKILKSNLQSNRSTPKLH